jgi:Tol biopolymer transport system component
MVVAALVIAFAGVQWSPDMQRATSSIFTVRADGSHRRRLSGKGNWTDTNPEWSRDRKRIAFGRYDSRGWRIMVMSASGRNLRAVTTRRPLAEAPTWSPDGRSLAFAGMPARLPMTGSFAQQIYIVSLRSGHARQLTPLSTFPGGAGLPAWSPDGKRIALGVRRSSADNAVSDIWTISPRGSDPRRVVRNADAPAWSPDGKRMAFVRDGDIYTVTLGDITRRLTRTPSVYDSDPSWCRDGARIAFATTQRAANPDNDDRVISIAQAGGSGVHSLRDGDPGFWADAPAC